MHVHELSLWRCMLLLVVAMCFANFCCSEARTFHKIFRTARARIERERLKELNHSDVQSVGSFVGTTGSEPTNLSGSRLSSFKQRLLANLQNLRRAAAFPKIITSKTSPGATDRVNLQAWYLDSLYPRQTSGANSTVSFFGWKLFPVVAQRPKQIAVGLKSYVIRSMAFFEQILDKATSDEDEADDEVELLLEERPAAFGVDKTNASKILSELIPFAKEYINLDPQKWQVVSEKNDIKVWRCVCPVTPFNVPSKWPCFRAATVLPASPEEITELMYDSSRMHLINRYSAGRSDVEIINNSSKIVHNRILDIIGIRKPHDFCSLMHIESLNDGTIMLISIGVEHEKAPEAPEYSRSHVIFGLNVMRPCPNGTEFTAISHVQYSGLRPYIVGYSMPFGMYSFMLQLKGFFKDSIGNKSNSTIRPVDALHTFRNDKI